MQQIKKIFWDVENGSVYWLEGNEVCVAPMNNDDTSNLEDGGPVEVWSEVNEYEAKKAEARVRAKLA